MQSDLMLLFVLDSALNYTMVFMHMSHGPACSCWKADAHKAHMHPHKHKVDKRPWEACATCKIRHAMLSVPSDSKVRFRSAADM